MLRVEEGFPRRGELDLRPKGQKECVPGTLS